MVNSPPTKTTIQTSRSCFGFGGQPIESRPILVILSRPVSAHLQSWARVQEIAAEIHPTTIESIIFTHHDRPDEYDDSLCTHYTRVLVLNDDKATKAGSTTRFQNCGKHLKLWLPVDYFWRTRSTSNDKIISNLLRNIRYAHLLFTNSGRS